MNRCGNGGIPAAVGPIPSSAAYTRLLGEAGATTWVLPQAQNSALLWLGIGNESLRPADFAGAVQLNLEAMDGPGHFALFFQDPFGQPLPKMNSRDGLNRDDTLAVPLGSHLHCNWAFSAPGRYRLRFVASGTLRAGNTPITSAPSDWFFDVVAPPPPVLALTRAPCRCSVAASSVSRMRLRPSWNSLSQRNQISPVAAPVNTTANPRPGSTFQAKPGLRSSAGPVARAWDR